MTTPARPTPAPIEWTNLIQAGRDLLSPQPAGRLPTHEHIRRATSNAYYAMFNALAESNANAVVARPPIRPLPPRGPESTADSNIPTPDGHCRAIARISPHQPKNSPTLSSTCNSTATPPTTTPNPHSPPTRARRILTRPKPPSFAFHKSRRTSGCTSPHSHRSGRGSAPTPRRLRRDQQISRH